jgi:hypothetical protein
MDKAIILFHVFVSFSLLNILLMIVCIIHFILVPNVRASPAPNATKYLYWAHFLDLPRKFESGTALGVRVHAPC